MRLFIDWQLVEEELVHDPAMPAIAEAVHRLAEAPAERASNDPLGVVLLVPGNRVVHMRYDTTRQVMVVLSVEPQPDPSGETDDDPHEYEPEATEPDPEPPASER